jgi:hypothetical protein
MDRMLLGIVVVRSHPVILSSCLRLEIRFLSWFSVSGLSNVAAHRRRANNVGSSTETRTRRLVHAAGLPTLLIHQPYHVIRRE